MARGDAGGLLRLGRAAAACYGRRDSEGLGLTRGAATYSDTKLERKS